MNLVKLIKGAVSAICVLSLSGVAVTTGYAEIINGNEVYNWSASSVKVPTVVPYSMDFNDTSKGIVPVNATGSSDTVYCTDMVCISNSIYTSDIYYDLKDQTNGPDGYMALEYVYNPASPGEAMKFKNEFYILNIPATKSNFTVDFELYNDGNADDVVMRTHRFCGYNEDWMNLSAYLQANKWQRIALTFMDTSVTLYVDGEECASVSRTINPSETTNAWVYLATNFMQGEARTSLTAMDNLRIYEGDFKAVELGSCGAADGSWIFEESSGFELKQEMSAGEFRQSISEIGDFGKMYDIQITDEYGIAVSDDALTDSTHNVRIQPVSYNEMYVDYKITCNIMLRNVRFVETEEGVAVQADYTNVTDEVQSVTGILTVWDGNLMKDITVFPIEDCQPGAAPVSVVTDCVDADDSDTVEFVVVSSLSQPYIISSKIYVK